MSIPPTLNTKNTKNDLRGLRVALLSGRRERADGFYGRRLHAGRTKAVVNCRNRGDQRVHVGDHLGHVLAQLRRLADLLRRRHRGRSHDLPLHLTELAAHVLLLAAEATAAATEAALRLVQSQPAAEIHE